jgi:putative membrane protein insertion efficiency factor
MSALPSAPSGGEPAAGARSRRRFLFVALLLALLLGFDLARAPAQQWSARALLHAIDGYQAVVSPVLPRAGMRCRFEPSCSHYGEEAIRARGALVGSALAGWRVLRCGPWTPYGTHDPPPAPR